MTLAAAKETVRAAGYTLRKIDGEFQVKPNGHVWDDAATSYHNDIDDAVGTALHRAEHDRY
jgi:hypothetical protein